MRWILTILACGTATHAIAGHELDNRDLLNGRTLYTEHCASCHGANLEGQPDWQRPDENGILPAPPHDESGHTWHHDNWLLFEYTRLGGAELLTARGIKDFESGMPGFGDAMSDDDIWDVLSYIRSTWPQRIQDIQDTRNPPHD
ncbi:c-type cytochrome [Hoeflea prorocentri]|uniref:Cytochrome c n=1 Tax=Hoeflea prorocentri TaxID=1922333 RepID=A0A9X3UMZ0_9HYPH|nr:cytochrome c [Hoeflea prorocentri]MCY6383360.1 cytochrome c [Hoeflea prorocentri]MDA5401160.1 cytochrome c [Hoeflea prorocentri]